MFVAMEEKVSLKKKSSWSFGLAKFSKKGGGGGGESKEQVPEEFVCPISQSLMADPVIVASGYSFERQCIQRWFQLGNRHCFKSGIILEHGTLTPNLQLHSMILGWCDKHKVARPQPPTAELAWQLVEASGVRAAPAPSAVPRHDSDLERPGFSGDGRPDPFDDDDDDDKSGGSSRSAQLSSGRDGGNQQQVEQEYSESSAPTSTTPDQDAPLWKRREQGTSSGEFNKSSEFRGSNLQSSSYNHPNSGEWPASPLQSRYVHSASAHVLRGQMENFDAHRDGIPLPLATTPSSYGISEAGEYGAAEGIEGELLYKLHHQHAVEQEEGAAEIRMLTRNTDPSVDYRATLCTPAVLEALVSLMQSRYSGVQSNAVAAIMNLSLSNENKIKIARAGAIPVLIEVLKTQCDAAQEHATGALFSLALSDENKMAIGVLGAIPPLIHVLRVGSQGARCDAAMALYQLSFAQINRGKLIKAGAVGILLRLLQEEGSDLVSRALLILSNLAVIPDGRSTICEGNGISVLVSLIAYQSSLGGPPDQVREHAAAALVQLSNHNLRFKAQALQAGALEPLTMLAEQGTQRARDKATLLLNILRTESKFSGAGDTALYAPALYGRKAADSMRPDSAGF
ncbi:unnamed protein product [Sphagnum compactum]